MTLIRYKNPIEISFYYWMKQYPESSGPLDMKRFYSFVKSICRYNSEKWKSTRYLKIKILEYEPNFKKNILNEFLNLHQSLIEFYKSAYLRGRDSIEKNVKKGFYIERKIKNNQVIETLRPMKEW